MAIKNFIGPSRRKFLAHAIKATLGFGLLIAFLKRKDLMAESKKLYKIYSPKEKHWVGDGFYVSTMFSMHDNENHYLSPFILLDHAAPMEFAPTDKKLGVGEHPHRGFETVTFAIQGKIDHRDSGGGGGTISSGGVQWMTAGSGVVHEEFHSKDFSQKGGVFEMVQLWVNLPAKDKMTTPRYQSMNKEDFPSLKLNEGKTELKIIAGEYHGKSGPALTHTPMNIFEVFHKSEGRLDLNFNEQTNTIIVQLKGNSKLADKIIKEGEIAVFERDGEQIQLNLDSDSHLLVLNGEPIDEPVAAYGPFVMNTRDEIRQAIDDFNAGKMGRLVEEAIKN